MHYEVITLNVHSKITRKQCWHFTKFGSRKNEKSGYRRFYLLKLSKQGSSPSSDKLTY